MYFYMYIPVAATHSHTIHRIYSESYKITYYNTSAHNLISPNNKVATLSTGSTKFNAYKGFPAIHYLHQKTIGDIDLEFTHKAYCLMMLYLGLCYN